MINYHEIWQSINEESGASLEKTQIARSVSSEGNLPIFIATDIGKKTRMLYVMTDNSNVVVIDDLPDFRGLEISYIITTIGRFRSRQFLRFTQSIPDTDSIFELVISDICDRIVGMRNVDDLSQTLKKVLNEWKFFFERLDYQILSVAEQKGLYAELTFLKNFLFKKFSFTDALRYWTGADRTNHDFQMGSIAVEIKATSSKQPKKFSVSSERQLDNTGLDHLYLLLFSLNTHDNTTVQTLVSLIGEIYEMIKADPVAAYQYQIKLNKYGFNAAFGNRYETGFSLTGLQTFEVSAGFPGIFPRSLPTGVGDVKYTVAAVACEQFEIKTDLLNLL